MRLGISTCLCLVLAASVTFGVTFQGSFVAFAVHKLCKSRVEPVTPSAPPPDPQQ